MLAALLGINLARGLFESTDTSPRHGSTAVQVLNELKRMHSCLYFTSLIHTNSDLRIDFKAFMLIFIFKHGNKQTELNECELMQKSLLLVFCGSGALHRCEMGTARFPFERFGAFER